MTRHHHHLLYYTLSAREDAKAAHAPWTRFLKVPSLRLYPWSGQTQGGTFLLIYAWAWEGNADPAHLTSNLMRVEWPRGSGRWLRFPEVDRCDWFRLQSAREKLNPAQAAFIDRLEAQLS